MLHAKVDIKGVETQREVVKEERRERIDNQPYGSIVEKVFEKAYQKHPYKWPIIALIREYQGTERHLLVEVKTDDAPASYRLAVGQLLDYRRLHPDRAAIDLAVQFPAKPKASALEFLGFVGVKVMWFNSAMKQLAGQAQLGGAA